MIIKGTNSTEGLVQMCWINQLGTISLSFKFMKIQFDLTEIEARKKLSHEWVGWVVFVKFEDQLIRSTIS